jgi:hypothetical protein
MSQPLRAELELFKQVIPDVVFPNFECPLSPKLFANMRLAVVCVEAPIVRCCVQSKVWSAIMGDPRILDLVTPTSNHELVCSGYLGSLLGIDIFTDAYSLPGLQFLPTSSLYVMSVTKESALHKCVCTLIL